MSAPLPASPPGLCHLCQRYVLACVCAERAKRRAARPDDDCQPLPFDSAEDRRLWEASDRAIDLAKETP